MIISIDLSYLLTVIINYLQLIFYSKLTDYLTIFPEGFYLFFLIFKIVIYILMARDLNPEVHSSLQTNPCS